MITRYFLVSLFLVNFINTQSVFCQNKGNGGAIAAAVAGGIIAGVAYAATVESIKEGMERNIVEWIYETKDIKAPLTFELKLIKWEATKKEDLSNVSVVGYKYHDFNEPPVVLLNACSPGWVTDMGINFRYVKVYELTQEYWSKMMLAYLNLVRENGTSPITDIENIPVLDKKGNKTTIPLYYIKSVSRSQMTFATKDGLSEYVFNFQILMSGDIHIGSNFDSEFKIDYNEGHLNLYLISTGDLIRIKRDFIVDITTNVFENKIERIIN